MSSEKIKIASEGELRFDPRDVIHGIEDNLERLIDMPDLSDEQRHLVNDIRRLTSSMEELRRDIDTIDAFLSAQQQLYTQLQKLINNSQFWQSINRVPPNMDSRDVAEAFLSDTEGFAGPQISPEKMAELIAGAEETLEGTPVALFKEAFQHNVDKLGQMILMDEVAEEGEALH